MCFAHVYALFSQRCCLWTCDRGMSNSLQHTRSRLNILMWDMLQHAPDRRQLALNRCADVVNDSATNHCMDFLVVVGSFV